MEKLVTGKSYIAQIRWADGSTETCRLELGAISETTVCAYVFHKDGPCVTNGEHFSAIQNIPIEWICGEWPTTEKENEDE